MVNPETHFKGWAKPGPVPPGSQAVNPRHGGALGR